MIDCIEKVKKLRDELEQRDLFAFVQPVHDEFQNEYLPAHSARVEWLTGFSGSSGTVVITRDKAAIFVDGRYTLQAGFQVDKTIFEIHNVADLMPEEWLSVNASLNDVVAYDDWLFTRSQLRRYATLNMRACENLVDLIWYEKPKANSSEIFPHPLIYSGVHHQDKIAALASQVKSSGADALIITAPDSLCWLYNIRGRDVPYTPFVLGYAAIKADGSSTLFLNSDHDKLKPELLEHLGQGVTVKNIGNFKNNISELGRIALDPSIAPSAIFSRAAAYIEMADPCQMPKACKNQVEIQGMRNAHIRDGKAVTAFIKWLKEELKNQKYYSESELAEILDSYRSKQDLYVSPSFATISGYNSNGAIVHYRAKKGEDILVKGDGLYLVDSGGQYLDATTDITRTISIGTPTKSQKRNFTLVLKGHIAIARIRFPEGTTGAHIDILARQFLWQNGKDFDHGTGHGVGSFLSVHEGPQRISRLASNVILREGMILSNEPGYYKAGEYGIRIENLVLVIDCGKMENGKKLLGFETLTKVPIDEESVDFSMLTSEELEWLEHYNKDCF